MFQILGSSRSGGQTISGQEQVVISPAGRWKATVTIPITDRRYGPLERQDAVLAFRWIVSGGRAATIMVPHRDGRGPAHRARIVPCGGSVPHSDGTPHSDDTEYAQEFTGAVLNAVAAMNATQITVTLATGLRMLPGMRFSLPDGRMHEIADIVGFNGANLWTVIIGPWLRADYPAGTPLNFDRAVCRMRLATDEGAALSLSLNRFGTPSLEFVEAF
ncbi:hypothetical protein [Methylobacterium bullatum]|nr:hypothetical protein [Methylobacterium bullatum]MBD8902790.1 hypothetical protein [Methylobacterium bullatum]